MISYARQQLLAEQKAGRSARTPSEFGRCISVGSEDEIQAQFFKWIDLHKGRFPALKLAFSIPNGSDKSKTLRHVMQLTGLRSGVPDVCIPVAKWEAHAPLYYSLWIEFKSLKGVVKPEQKEWHQMLRDAGHRVEICRSWIDAANLTIEYLGLRLEKIV